MSERQFEMAEAMAQRANESGIAHFSKNAIPTRDLLPHEYKRLDCEVCGEDLTEFRMQKGRTICTECQGLREQALKRRM